MSWNANTSAEAVDADDGGDYPEGLDVGSVTKPARHEVIEPSAREPSRVGGDAMDRIDDVRRQLPEARVLTRDRIWRQRRLSLGAQPAAGRVPHLGGDRDSLRAGPPAPGLGQPLPGAAVRGREVFPNGHLCVRVRDAAHGKYLSACRWPPATSTGMNPPGPGGQVVPSRTAGRVVCFMCNAVAPRVN